MQTSAASTRPSVTIEDLSDPAVAGVGIELLDLDAVKLQSKPFRATRVTVRLAHATALFTAVDLRLRSRTRVREGHVAYAVYGPKARGTVNGMPIQPGLLLAAAAGAEARFVVDATWQSATFVLPEQHVAEHFRTRQRERRIRQPCGLELLQVDAQKAQTLFQWGERLARTATAHPASFDADERLRVAAEVEMIELLLATLDAADEIRPARSDRSRQVQSQIVRIAEDHALAHVGEPLYVTDLCRAAAVSERKLASAFKDILGLTPVAFLTRLRLHRVRQALLASAPGSTTVAAQALNWGFWHLGEFGRVYKDCFGELPSQTLRRRRGESAR